LGRSWEGPVEKDAKSREPWLREASANRRSCQTFGKMQRPAKGRVELQNLHSSVRFRPAPLAPSAIRASKQEARSHSLIRTGRSAGIKPMTREVSHCTGICSHSGSSRIRMLRASRSSSRYAGGCATWKGSESSRTAWIVRTERPRSEAAHCGPAILGVCYRHKRHRVSP